MVNTKCSKCGGRIQQAIPNTKLSTSTNRTQCYNCSPFVSNMDRDDKRQESINAADPSLIVRCASCDKDFIYTATGAQTKTKCGPCNANHGRFYKKNLLVEYKGGCCVVCGYSKCTDSLTFHHIDPSTKSFSISGAHCRSVANLKAEVDKCALLCHNCHGELHANEMSDEDLVKVMGNVTYKPAPDSKVELDMHVAVWPKIVEQFGPFLDCICGKQIRDTGRKYCSSSCCGKDNEVADWPENLHELVWQEPVTTIAAKLGVSGRAVAKRCKKFGISVPGIGYWARARRQ
jgi:hypothetical protein